MKKSYILIAAMAAALCMAGCSSQNTTEETEIQTETVAETETESETEAQTESETEAQTETKAETKAETETQAKTETEAQTSAPENQASDGENEDTVSDDPSDYISVYVTDGQAAQNALGLGADEYSTLFVLTTQEEIYDITLWRLDMYTDDDGDLHGSEIEFLGSRETLEAGESQELSIDPGETMPVAGFSFIDQGNRVHHYYLAISGEDGSAYFGSYSWE